MKPWFPLAEMLWRLDAQVEAARKLPEWKQFHRLCGEHGLYFDHIEKKGRSYTATAYTVKKRRHDLYDYIPLGSAEGKTPVQAIAAALEASGRNIPGAAAMLSRGLNGIEETEDFDDLLDDFEELL